MIPPPLNPGDPLYAAWLNQLRDAVLAEIVGDGDVVVRRAGSRLTVGLARRIPGVQGAIVAQFVVASVGDDHLVCRTWDGSNQGDADVLVAKPWLLRKTPFHGLTLNGKTYIYDSGTARNVDDGNEDEDQVIIPSYTDPSGAVIYAVRGVVGGTGVVVESDPVVWLDLNVDGRAWAKKHE